MTEDRNASPELKQTPEEALADYWDTVDLDDHAGAVTRLQELVTTLDLDESIAHFEMRSVYDSVGDEQAAVVEYEAARASGLTGSRRPQLDIQYASTLRNLGRLDEAVDVLRAAVPDPSTGDARTVFLALALHDSGRSAEALKLTIDALTPYLPRYRQSVAAYARALLDPPTDA